MAPFQRVGAGQKRRFSATEHNAFVDAALDYRQRARSAMPIDPRDALPPGMIRVRNDSGADRARYETLAIDGVLPSTSSSAEQLRYGPTVKGVTPAPDTTESHGRNFVVLDQPIKSGKIGRAFLDGLAVATVNVSDVAHGYVEPAAGTNLISAETGPAKLLWAPATGVQDCLVQLGDPAGGGANAIAYSASGIPAASGTTPGSATVDIYKIESAALAVASPAITETVYNLSETAIEANTYFPVHREYLTNEWVASEGSGSGGGGGGAEHCGYVRFSIVSVTKSETETNSALVDIESRPCGCTEVPDEEAGQLTVYDPMGCHLSDEEAADYVGRQGTASYMTTPPRPDGDFDKAFNFRSSLSYVTDEAGETHINSLVAYPPHGWEDTTNADEADRDSTVDRRLAGVCMPTGTNTIKFKVDLPAAGLYRITLALGDAAGAATLDAKILDGATTVATYANSLSFGEHVDAAGAVHTSAAWPDVNDTIDHEFAGTTFELELIGSGSRVNHVRIQSLRTCWWEMNNLCCPLF